MKREIPYIYVFVPRSVVGDIMFCPVLASLHASGNIDNTTSCEDQTSFHQTYIDYALYFNDTEERFRFGGQKIKVQGQGGIKYAGKSPFASFEFN